MNYFEQSMQWFLLQTKLQKRTLISGLIGITVLTSGLIYWILSPNYAVLFNHLDSQDANQIITQLEVANIPYQIKNQGKDILIDKKLIDKTRIKLMGEELNLTHNVGFELFDKTDFGMTDFSQKINYQRALQGELERTISSLNEIKKARVQLVIPETHLFQEEHNLPRAAITLHLNRPLTTGQVKSIQQLITASVAHMPASNVVIVDQNGNGLTLNEEDSINQQFNAKKAIELYLSSKVLQILTRVFPKEEVMVTVDATLNYDELQRERLSPSKQGLITHEKEIRHIQSLNKKGKHPKNQDINYEKNYELGHEKEQFKRANGTLERLSISVAVPQNTDSEKITRIERLVQAVVGFDAHRGDKISVEALIVKHSLSMPIKKSVRKPRYTVLLPITILFILTALFLIHRHKRLQRKQVLLNELSQWLIEHA